MSRPLMAGCLLLSTTVAGAQLRSSAHTFSADDPAERTAAMPRDVRRALESLPDVQDDLEGVQPPPKHLPDAHGTPTVQSQGVS